MADKKYNLVLTMSDGTKKTMPLIVPQGPQGKSAYDTAKDGGYTGTEEQFAAKLAALQDSVSIDDVEQMISDAITTALNTEV